MAKTKKKIDQDQMAMLIADWQHGEFTTCEPEVLCRNCPLNKEITIRKEYHGSETICNLLLIMSESLNEVEHE